jgi:hypothetical protein
MACESLATARKEFAALHCDISEPYGNEQRLLNSGNYLAAVVLPRQGGLPRLFLKATLPD